MALIKSILRGIIKTIFRLRIMKYVFLVTKMFYIPKSSYRIEYFKFEGKYKVRINNQFVHLYNKFYLENEIFWLGFENFNWEKKTRRIWSNLCEKSNVIFDIGANSGIFSVIAKVSNPKSNVFAFEPQPNIYEVLQKNSVINKFDINCMNIALSNSNGTLPFYNYGNYAFDGNTTAGSLNKEFRPENQKSIMVKVTELTTFVHENNISKIDLIKMDVETHEFEVLQGYKELLNLHTPMIIIEIQNEQVGKNVSEIVKLDTYKYFLIDEEIGLVEVEKLGGNSFTNYFLCPISQINIIGTL